MQSSLARCIKVSSVALLVLALALGCGDVESIGKPSNLRLVNIADYDAEAGGFRSVTIEWNQLEEASTYQVQRAAPDSGRDFEFIQWSGAWLEDHGYLLDEPFLPGHTYVYRVRGFRRVAGPWSDELEVRIPLFQPPENLTAAYREADNTVVLEWDGEDDPQLRWRVSRTSDRPDEPGSGDHPDWVEDVQQPYFEDWNVVPGCSYEYEVRTRHHMFGETEGRTVAMEIPQAPGPVMLDATEGDPESITVSWERAQDFSGANVSYQLYRATADPENEDSYEQIPTHQFGFGHQNDRVTYVDESIQHGAWHYYRAKISFSPSGFLGCSSYSEMSENYVAGWGGPEEPDEPPSG